LEEFQRLVSEKELSGDELPSLLKTQFNGKTPLFLACLSKFGRLDFVKHLHLLGSDLNALSPNKLSILNAAYASQEPNLEVIEYLLESNCGCHNADARGNNLLHYAIDNDRTTPAMSELLLKRGVDPNRANASGLSPMFKAAQRGRFDLMKLLAGYGGALDARNNNDNTLLMYACMYNQLEIIRYLVERGAEVNFADKQGDTAFLYLCGCDNHQEELDLECIRYLVGRGADHTKTGLDGFTALMYASRCLNRVHFRVDAEVIEYLIDLGVDPKAESTAGQVYLDYLLSDRQNDGVAMRLIRDGYVEISDERFVGTVLLNDIPGFRTMVLKNNRFPVKTPSDGECGICRTDFGGHDVYIECPYQHCYHSVCLFMWFRKGRTDRCPFCSQKVDVMRGLSHVKTTYSDRGTQWEDL
jgi:ankyrin repeat protein